MSDASQNSATHRFKFDRYIDIPPNAEIHLPEDVLALATQIETVTQSTDLTWNIRFARHSINDDGAESLARALGSLSETPESINLTGFDGPSDGAVRVDLSVVTQIRISGSERTWVAATEDVLLEEVRRRFQEPPRGRVWPRGELLMAAYAIAAGLGVAVVVLPLNLLPPLAAVPVSAVIAGVYIHLFQRFDVSRHSGAHFVLVSGVKQMDRRAWYQHPVAEGTRLILQIVGGLWVVVQVIMLLATLVRSH